MLKLYMFNLIVLQGHQTSRTNKLKIILCNYYNTSSYEVVFSHVSVYLPGSMIQTEFFLLLAPKRNARVKITIIIV
jgi:hypothetical protein